VPPNPTFDELVTTTLKNYRAQMADNITNQAVFWKWMRDNKRFRTEPGGTSLVEPLLHAENTTVKSYSKWDTIDITPQTGITAAEFSWKQIAGSLSINGFEEFVNQPSKTRVLSLLKAKIMQLEISFREVLNAMIVAGDGTGNSGKDITGLALALEDGQAWSTYGGINRATGGNEFWRNRWIEWGFTSVTAANFGSGGNAAGIQKMKRAYNLCSRGTQRVQLVLTDLNLFELYEAALAINERFNMPQRFDAGGFDGLMFRNVPIMFDEDVLAGYMYMINFMFLTMVTGRGRDFMPLPFVRPPDQEARVTSTVYYGQLTASNNKRSAVITPTNAGGGE